MYPLHEYHLNRKTATIEDKTRLQSMNVCIKVKFMSMALDNLYANVFYLFHTIFHVSKALSTKSTLLKQLSILITDCWLLSNQRLNRLSVLNQRQILTTTKNEEIVRVALFRHSFILLLICWHCSVERNNLVHLQLRVILLCFCNLSRNLPDKLKPNAYFANR